MIRTQVYLPADVYQDLKHAAAREGVSLAELIRQGAETILDKKKQGKIKRFEKLLRLSGTIKGETKDLGEKHDQYLFKHM